MCEEEASPQPSIFGQRVKSARERRRMSQDSLAERARVSPATISRIEDGKIQWARGDIAARIARVLEADLNWLLGVYDKREPPGTFVPVVVGLAAS